MTTPVFDINEIVPRKWKPLVGLIGSLLAFIIPTVLEAATSLPSPWPLVIAAAVAGLTWLGIYHSPYVPPGAVLAPETVISHDGGQEVVLPPTAGTSGEYQNPWK